MVIPTEKLYDQELLGITTELAQFPLKGNWDSIVEVRSKTCGSMLKLGISLNQHNELSNLGFSVSACAFGQAAAALFARSALGLTAKKCQLSHDGIEEWLNSPMAPIPDWPDIKILENARAYVGRHGAIILPWKAASQILCKNES